jgi:hypothetical protein
MERQRQRIPALRETALLRRRSKIYWVAANHGTEGSVSASAVGTNRPPTIPRNANLLATQPRNCSTNLASRGGNIVLGSSRLPILLAAHVHENKSLHPKCVWS